MIIDADIKARGEVRKDLCNLRVGDIIHYNWSYFVPGAADQPGIISKISKVDELGDYYVFVMWLDTYHEERWSRSPFESALSGGRMTILK
jgi:hypothetical protein